MSWIRSRQLVLAITLIFGFLVLFPYYFNVPAVEKISSNIQNSTVVLLAFALGYGALTLTIEHTRKILGRKAGWQYSIALLLSLWAMIITGSIPPLLTHPAFQWLYQYMQVRVNAAVFALLAPFIASAAYKAFKARSIEPTLMLVSAFFVMMLNAPIGGYLWQGFIEIGSWIYSTPNDASQRGVMIGIAVGTILLALRIYGGYERTHSGEGI